MSIVKESSPPRQWCNLANDVISYLSEPTLNVEPYIERLANEWTYSEKHELSDIFGGKKRRGIPNSGVKFLLSSFENEQSEPNLLITSRVLDAVVHIANQDKRKEKALIKADIVTSLTRALRKRILMRIDSTQRYYMDPAIDEIMYYMLYTIGNKDNRFNTKVRLSGFISAMCRLFIKFEDLPNSFYPIFIRISRSPRNGQMIGRQEGFMNRLIARINSIKSSDKLEDVRLMEKYIQLLFFTLKNRRTRIQMVKDSICRVVVDILRKHVSLTTSANRSNRLFSSIFGTNDSANSALMTARGDLVLGCIAILRLLANNKKAKDEMIGLGTMDVCANALKETSDESNKGSQRLKIEESLCALWLRCMQSVNYPLENVRFPLEFPLPQVVKTRVRNSTSVNISFDNGRSSDEDVIDEEDMTFQEPAASNCEQSDEDDAKENGQPPKTTSLSIEQLSKYGEFFKEIETGTMNSMDVEEMSEEWLQTCGRTKNVMPVVKLLPFEMFNDKEPKREKLIKSPDSIKPLMEELSKSSTRQKTSHIVYDLDSIVFDKTSKESHGNSTNLVFESRFESGNLRRATLVAPNHYELYLTPDVNQLRDHFQWFFFEVSNMQKDVRYTFEIVNCLKSTSMYSEGMQPVMYSTIGGRWTRAGENVCYYRNMYSHEAASSASSSSNSDEKNGEEKKKVHYYSIRFDLTFPNNGDRCYLAYHYPYTYSCLNANLLLMQRNKLSAIYCREDVIGHTVAGNELKMLTITSTGCSPQEISARPFVVISARVHPGESNSSWMMQGVLEWLLCGISNELYRLRERYVFKIVPMLNPDGVINGSHRCSLAGIDLNRVWDRPNEQLHPEIYGTKAIIQYMCDVLKKKPHVFVDLHGHSRKWDCFVFGNNAAESWRKEDLVAAENEDHLALPKALEQKCAGKFNIGECRYSITRAKESSARVNVWRQFGVTASYTLECTYCGFKMAANKGYQINTEDLKEIGKNLVEALLEIPDRNGVN